MQGDNLPTPSVVAQTAVDLELVPDSKLAGPVDKSTIFLTYLSFFGDVEKTSIALDIAAEYITKLADAENWASKVAALVTMRKDQGADAVARELNRTVNYVQSVRLRNIIDRTLREITKDEDAFENFLTSYGKDSTNRSCKALTELVKAAQTVQLMTYSALGDTCSERTARDPVEGAQASSLFSHLSRIASTPQDPVKSADPTGEARQGLLEAGK